MSERERLVIEIVGGALAASLVVFVAALTAFLFYIGGTIVWAMVM
jgi:hypothetical protein